ncbi:MAG: hopanoid biosynthesis protein HpnM [Methylomonas sp.]|nr:MAG: hopanoid biosynthesis protein HpnM [Methylomonas sp.]
MTIKTIIVAFSLLITLGSLPVSAIEAAAMSPRQVVEKFQSELVDVMKNGQKLGFKGRYDKLEDAVANSHDLPKIARIVIGQEWEKLSPEQQQKFTDVFSRLSIASYAHNFKDYSGENFVFDSESETKRGGVVVFSHLNIPDDKPVEFEYQLKDNNGTNWRIINIIANGVSDLAVKRSEYTSILQRDGFDALVGIIGEKIDSYSKQ